MQQHDENVVSPIPWFVEEQDGTALTIRDKIRNANTRTFAQNAGFSTVHVRYINEGN